MRRIVMMIALMMCFVFNSFSQRQNSSITNTKIGPIDWSYSMSINLETQDTTYYVSGKFKNFKYSYINDIKVIVIIRQLDLKQLIVDLKQVYNKMGNDETINYKREFYVLNLYDFTKNLYIGDSRDLGYTYLTKNQVEKTYMFLETINLSNKF